MDMLTCCYLPSWMMLMHPLESLCVAAWAWHDPHLLPKHTNIDYFFSFKLWRANLSLSKPSGKLVL